MTSCSDENTPGDPSGSILLNTMTDGGMLKVDNKLDNTFNVLLWRDVSHLTFTLPAKLLWPEPYYTGHAPQPITFYSKTVFDTRYPYPAPSTSYIYATGYSPAKVLVPDDEEGYKLLYYSNVEDANYTGRYDFMGCDVWPEVYRGSQDDPFAQDKNKLYFRHLAAKLIFYADRDETTMENKQYVRKVVVRNLQMSIDGGKTWTAMYTPSAFEWQALNDDDITNSYQKVIDAVKLIPGNDAATESHPIAGYKAVEATTFAGLGSDFVLDRNTLDRVPVYGMSIDSCFVCNPIVDRKPQSGQPIQLRMDISAEMSFDFNFPKPDNESSTDDLTFTREWKNVVLTAIYKYDESAPDATPTEKIREFKPGNEYRVYIHFNRSGVNLVAKELPWGFGGQHYITIYGGDIVEEEKESE